MTKVFTTALFLMLTGYVHAACTTPSGAAGRMEYFSTEETFKYCNGTSWVVMGGPEQFTADPGACNAGAEGTIKYTGGTPPWEYCDGTTWTGLESSGSAGTACTDDSTSECVLDATRSNNDAQLLPENIKDGVTILGVTGTYTASGGGGGSANAACVGTANDISGYCWYPGPSGQSCDTVCAAQGLSCNIEGTRDFVGSGGSGSQCAAIAGSLAFPVTVSSAYDSDFGVGVGCGWHSDYFEPARENVNTTTCSATYTPGSGGDFYRVCACD